MVKNCLICNKLFYAKPSKVRHGNAKYCSKKCYHSTWVGKHHTEEAKRKIGIASSGKNNPMFGVRICGEKHHGWSGGKPKCKHCKKQLNNYHNGMCSSCLYKRRRGKNHPSYIDGRSSLGLLIRGIDKYKRMRTETFTRDNFKCVQCGIGGNIHMNHKKQFALILKEYITDFNQFSPFEDKETLARLSTSYQPFWDLNNVETLCFDFHKKTETYARRVGK